MKNLSRRSFLKTSTAAASFLALSRNAKASHPLRRVTGKKVAILGGGVGGMSAAHELIDRGFNVTVYETNSLPGGKARSIPMPGTGTEGRQDLPGEHGFRFFPGFYSHLDHTMGRIPFGNNKTTLDNLVAPQKIGFARQNESDIQVPIHLPRRNISQFSEAVQTVFHAGLGIPRDDIVFFTKQLLTLLTSCEERRFAEYEMVSWWSFIEAEIRSANYKRFLASGLMRCLVACQPKKISARTGGYTFLQLLFSTMGMNKSVDRVLNGPTNEQWLFPWITHLQNHGVNYNYNSTVNSLHFNNQTKLLEGAVVTVEGRSQDIIADHYILAVPLEVANPLITSSMKATDPQLSRMENLEVEWMNGIQFFLTEDVLQGLGHNIYFDSPWAITSISQKQYWRDFDFSRIGNGEVKAVLSVDVSDWNTPGILFNKKAKNCTKEEVIEEVWAQMKSHLNDSDREILRDDMKLFVHLDPAIGFPSPGTTTNKEPLLVNTVGSWNDRPTSTTLIENFHLASDYVKSHMDLASMEAANEGARRAVNGILSSSGMAFDLCMISPLEEPSIFAPLKEYDRLRFHRGEPHDNNVLNQFEI